MAQADIVTEPSREWTGGPRRVEGSALDVLNDVLTWETGS